MRGLLDDLLVADGVNGSVKLPNIIFCLDTKIQDIDITIFLDFFAEIEPRIHPYPVLFGFHSSWFVTVQGQYQVSAQKYQTYKLLK